MYMSVGTGMGNMAFVHMACFPPSLHIGLGMMDFVAYIWLEVIVATHRIA